MNKYFKLTSKNYFEHVISNYRIFLVGHRNIKKKKLTNLYQIQCVF